MRRTRRPGRLLAAAVTVLTLAVSGCSGDDGDDAPASAPSASPTAQEVITDARFGRIQGRLPVAKRAAVRDRLQGVFDRWVDTAYLGEWPRTQVDGAFADFTDGARRRARRDLALLSNQAIGDRVDGVTAQARLLRIDVVAAGGRAVGATARFRLRFRTTGEVAGTHVVQGRLLLTPEQGSWKVFGYDVSRQEA